MKVKHIKPHHLLKLSLLLCLVFLTGFLSSGHAQTGTPLRADQAFKLVKIQIDNKKQLVSYWQVAEHYYLYESKFDFEINNKAIKLGKPIFPKTTIYKYFPTGERIKAHTGHFEISIPFTMKKRVKNPVSITITYQGCSTVGLCYPMQTVTKTLSFKGINPTKPHVSHKKPHHPQTHAKKPQDSLTRVLQGKSLSAIIIAFFIAGSLLSLTPCVLPMIPILSSIIIGQKKITHLHSFMLSLTYVLAMAITYAVIGLLVGLAGAHIQAALQNAWVIIIFTVIFILMALSLFGLYNLQLPEWFRHRVSQVSEHQKHGTYIGTAIMGILATLILSPCVTPALAGAIIYLGDKGDPTLGASALFAMGIGMGLPLLALGVFGPKFLPKPGYWMNIVKYFFGVVLLGVAIYMLSRIIPTSATMVLWGLLTIGCAIAIGFSHRAKGTYNAIIKILSIIIFIWGVLIVIGAIIGATDPLKPISTASSKHTPVQFKLIKTRNDLRHIFQLARKQRKPVLLDFYANWCTECKIMEETTFSNPTVKALAKKVIFIRADVSKNDTKDKALQKRLKVIAPPTILFFNYRGREIKHSRLIGSTDSKTLIKQLQKILK